MTARVYVYCDPGAEAAQSAIALKLTQDCVALAVETTSPVPISKHVISIVCHDENKSDPHTWESFFDHSDHGRNLVIHLHKRKRVLLDPSVNFRFGRMSRHRLLEYERVSIEAIRELLQEYADALRLHETMRALSAKMRQADGRSRVEQFHETTTGKRVPLAVNGAIPVVLSSAAAFTPARQAELQSGTGFELCQPLDVQGRWHLSVVHASDWSEIDPKWKAAHQSPYAIPVLILEVPSGQNITHYWASMEGEIKSPACVCVSSGSNWQLLPALKVALSRLNAFARLVGVGESQSEATMTDLVDLVARLDLDTTYLSKMLPE